MVLVGTSNAVNLTDGLDGLAISVTIVAASALTAFTYVTGHIQFADYLDLVHIPTVWEVTILGELGWCEPWVSLVQRATG